MNIRATCVIAVSPFKHIGRSLLMHLLSPYGKRIFFLTSLYMHMKQQHVESVHCHTLQKLNETLSLARNEDALMLAAYSHNAVWRGVQLNTMIDSTCDPRAGYVDSSSVQNLCDRIIQQSPKWLRYGSRDQMVHDISSLLEIK